MTKPYKSLPLNLLKNENYTDLFPLAENSRSLRKTKKYLEEYARTEKLYNSPFFKMRRVLNEISDKERTSDKGNYLELDHLFNDPCTEV